ncbi:flagellar operon protein TIGR03826 [Alicyclobacillus vulcanalis]|uniref:Flagellar operon protein TIGR03826 n=1 Tax=Alicyclobacillus vulcanalis TaxID=252246 RepID=A0A1N7JNJ2_9BACL|nr:flagellar operon protein TIGR03826 [Alicyclobacillus vulcanalis]
MAIANCRRCGKLYNRVGRDICPDCMKQEDEHLTAIRAYLRQHPLANIYEVSNGTGVPYDEIVQFLRDGRLLLRNNPNMVYPCDRCGTPTQSGRLCANCAKEMARELRPGQRPDGRDRNPGFYSKP